MTVEIPLAPKYRDGANGKSHQRSGGGNGKKKGGAKLPVSPAMKKHDQDVTRDNRTMLWIDGRGRRHWVKVSDWNGRQAAGRGAGQPEVPA